MNQRSVKVSCVSYLNSTPFVHGLLQHDFAGKLDLSLDIPSVCANKLITGKADIGLVPVAAISDIPGAQRISKWCIGADGPVKSVTLLSPVPLDQIETILLDYHSVTSVNLTKVLAKCFWKIKPVWINAKEGFEKNIVGTTAAVIIGDRSLEMQHLFPYVYDLAGEWKNYTGLPFVFACWVSNKEIAPDFLNEFDASLEYGVNHIDDVVTNLAAQPNFYADSISYMKNNLKYAFTDEMKKGMELFLDYKNSIEDKIIIELR